MKFYYQSMLGTQRKVECTRIEALARLRGFNPEFCNSKTDDELVKAMLQSPIHTNLRKYWAERVSS